MKSARFHERLLQRARRAGVRVTDESINQLEAYYRLLDRWNRKINLTSLPLEAMSDQAIDRVLVEPLVAAEAIDTSSLAWFDLGSGGGSPAIPIKIVRPLAQLTLVEARSRKAAFLREAVRELALSNVTVIDDRFESVARRAEFTGAGDLVTVRGVRSDAALFDSSRALLKAGAHLLLFTTRGATIPASLRFEFDSTISLIPGVSKLVNLKAR